MSLAESVMVAISRARPTGSAVRRLQAGQQSRAAIPAVLSGLCRGPMPERGPAMGYVRQLVTPQKIVLDNVSREGQHHIVELTPKRAFWCR